MTQLKKTRRKFSKQEDEDCGRGVPKFNEVERAEAIRKALQWKRRGWTLADIAHEVGVSIPVVHGWVKKETLAQRERNAADRDADLQECIAGYLEVMREAWMAWERSKENAQERTEKKRVDEGEEEGDIEKEFTLVELVTSGRLPSNEYLRTVIDCWDRVRELKGLETPGEAAAGQVAATVAFVAGVIEQARAQRECQALEGRLVVNAVNQSNPLEESSHAIAGESPV